MWLLNVETHQLQQYPGPLAAPKYAVLSHCWASQETTLDDLKPYLSCPDNAEKLKKCASSDKILGACAKALALGVKNLWTDSLCVEWSSKTELSEAINSMFNIYQDSEVCLAYLDDSDTHAELSPEPGQCIEQSKWRNRVWVLQELIAPCTIFFYDKNWTKIGTKSSLIGSLSRILCIDKEVLENSQCLSDFTIGRRISWAACLSTDKPEDAAYALLSILKVKMPISYGEKHEAFLRLQEHILKQTEDATVLLWLPKDGQRHRGLLAHSPSEFSHFRNDKVCWPSEMRGNIQISSTGILVDDIFHPHPTSSDLLLCLFRRRRSGISSAIGIPLKKCQDHYFRSTKQLISLGCLPSGVQKQICVNRDIGEKTCSATFPQLSHVLNTQMQVSRKKRKASEADLSTDLSLGGTESDYSKHRTSESRICLNSTTFGRIEPLSNGTTCSQRGFPSEKILENDIELLADQGLQCFSKWYTLNGAYAYDLQGVEEASSQPRKKLRMTHDGGGIEVDNPRSEFMASASQNITDGFFCPFQLQNPRRYWRCMKQGRFSNIRHLRKHLISEHRRPYHCPICLHTFDLASLRDEHIKKRFCNAATFPQIEGLSNTQIRQLSRRPDPSQPKEVQWRVVWNIIFDGMEPPANFNLQERISGLVLSMSEFWFTMGQRVLFQAMGSVNFVANIIAMTEKDLRMLGLKVMDRMVDQLLRIGFKISVRE